MQITLVERDRVTVTDLPEKANGQYWIERKNMFGREERLLSIEGVEGRWLLRSGRNVVLRGKDGEDLKDSYLHGVEFLPLYFRKTGEQALLLVEDIPPSDRAIQKYNVPNDAQIRVGNDPANDIVLRSKFIAPIHAALQYSEGVFRIRNLDSAHGIYINSLRAEHASLAPGDTVFFMGVLLIVGKDFLALNRPSLVEGVSPDVLVPFQPQIPIAAQPEEYFDDQVAENTFFRSPRFKRDIETKTIRLDSPPSRQTGPGMPLMFTLGPSMTMGMASLFTAWYSVTNTLNSGGTVGQAMPSIVMAGSMLLGTLMWPLFSKRYEAAQNRKKEKIRQKKYYAYLEKIKNEISSETRLQSEILHENLLSTDDCVRRIETRDRTLWERMPEHNDFLKIRLGLGDLPLDLKLEHQQESFTVEEDELADAMRLLARTPRVLRDVPVPLPLQESFVTGIIGNRGNAVPFVRSMIFQLAALHSYTDLKLIFLYDEAEEEQWRFVRWLPHVWNEDRTVRFVVNSQDYLKEISAYFEPLLAALKDSDSQPGKRQGPGYIIFSASRELTRKAEMLNMVLEMDNYRGFSAVLLCEELNHLPKECTKVIELGEEESRVYDRGDITGQYQRFVPDLCGIEPEKPAIALANVRLDESDKAFALPGMLTFLDMFGIRRIEHLNPLERWKENNPVHTLQAPIGVGTSGDCFFLDLHEKYHGPHGLIAGMTGSGKSEFIMTYILSLALNYHPYEVAFILIDYKGGGMANAFENLPHLAGTITNLDGAAVNRSLVSIQSELKRRQAIFGETGKKVGVSNIDIYKYQKLYREGAVDEPLQHLFIISDEFAELKSQQPEFMQQLVSAARIGRSLGVHLILATQKPSGVVDDQIWSNSRFRVCLKVQENSDSMEVIKRPDAAALSVTGRFYVQVGFNEVFELGQSAWGGAPYFPDQTESEKQDDSVAVIDLVGRVVKQVKPPRRSAQTQNPPKQLDEITKYLKKLADDEGIKVRPLWLEPVNPIIFVDRLAEKYDYRARPFCVNPVIGEYDNPKQQSQGLLTLPIDEKGNVLVYGSGGNGKTTFVNAMVYATLQNHTAEEVHFYLLDFGSETLSCFRDAPQVGDVIFSYDSEKIENLFRKLQSELSARKKLFVDAGGDYASYVRHVAGIPRIIVVIHNYAAFSETCGDSLESEFYHLTREGAKYGVNFVLTCTGTSDVRFKLMQNFSQTFCLQLNDPSEYAMVISGGTERIIPAKHKGRGLCLLDDLYEFQTAHVAEPDNVLPYIRSYCSGLSGTWRGERAPHIAILPERCDTGFLSPYLTDSGKIPIGVDRKSLDILYYDFPCFLNFVVHDTADPLYFMQGLAELYAASGADMTVIDAEQNFPGVLPYDYAGDMTAIQEAVESLFQLILSRNNAYKEALENQCAPPVFEPKLFLIHGLHTLFHTVDSHHEESLSLALQHGRPEYKVRIIASCGQLSSFTRSEWYSRQFGADTFVWLGAGISDNYQIKVSGNSAELREDIPDDFGYLVEKGRPRPGKLAVSAMYEEYAAMI